MDVVRISLSALRILTVVMYSFMPNPVVALNCQDVEDEIEEGVKIINGLKCGGSTVLTEVPEMFGAEQILM